MYDCTSLNASNTFWNEKSIFYQNNAVLNFYNYEKGTRIKKISFVEIQEGYVLLDRKQNQ